MNLQPDFGQRDFSSRGFLRLLETFRSTGNWGWTFGTNEHVWSPGFYRLLGLEPEAVRPSYNLFVALVHPEDRYRVQTAEQVMAGGLLQECNVRVIRPDGSIRVLWSRGEVLVTPEGRPRAASGVILDVTDRELLARARYIERRWRLAVFEQTRLIQFTSQASGAPLVPPELCMLTGRSREEIEADHFATVAKQEREASRSQITEKLMAGQPIHMTSLMRLKDQPPERFHGIGVPIRDRSAAILEWAIITYPAGGPSTMSDLAREGLEQAVQGHHLRAARALLDWSMLELATASGLSFSTIRRLEDGEEKRASRSRHTAIAALRTAGIRFMFLDDNTIAVARR